MRTCIKCCPLVIQSSTMHFKISSVSHKKLSSVNFIVCMYIKSMACKAQVKFQHHLVVSKNKNNNDKKKKHKSLSHQHLNELHCCLFTRLITVCICLSGEIIPDEPLVSQRNLVFRDIFWTDHFKDDVLEHRHHFNGKYLILNCFFMLMSDLLLQVVQ